MAKFASVDVETLRSDPEATRSITNIYGMPIADMATLLQISEERDEVLAFRPVHRLARSLIETNAYVGKPFGIDAKSCVFGPAFGFLTLNPVLSGRFDPSNQDEMDEYLKSTGFAKTKKYMSEKYHFKEKPLQLSLDRLKELEDEKIIQCISPEKDKKRLIYVVNHPKGSNPEFKYIADLQDDGSYKISYLDEEKKEKDVLVIANAEDKFVITDYDLFVVAPFGYDSIRDLTPIRVQGNLTPAQLQQKIFKTVYETELLKDIQNEDPSMGNVTPRIKELVGILSSRLPDKIYHNAETNNFFANPNMEANLPGQFFLPKKYKLSELGFEGDEDDPPVNLLLIETKEELECLRNHLIDLGVYWPTNVNYPSLHPLGSPRYQAIVKAFERYYIEPRTSRIDRDITSSSGETGIESPAATPDPSRSSSAISDTARSSTSDPESPRDIISSHMPSSPLATILSKKALYLSKDSLSLGNIVTLYALLQRELKNDGSDEFKLYLNPEFDWPDMEQVYQEKIDKIVDILKHKGFTVSIEEYDSTNNNILSQALRLDLSGIIKRREGEEEGKPSSHRP